MTHTVKPSGVMVAMSGGVDSAVAAYLISQKHPCAGVTMRVLNAHTGGEDTADRDIQGAATVCNTLGIPHFTAELAEEFFRCVITPFMAAYAAGETPNPCIFCNRSIKFGALMHFALQHGYSDLATGHYVKVERTATGRTLLRRATDTGKDQTYMLWSLTQDVLNHCHFPLGDLSKAQARELAAELGFPMAAQKDSQDICFVPDGDYAAFIRRMTGTEPLPGNFIDKNGAVLGQHKGQLHYTVGQRKGLGIALGRPAFVTAKSAVENTVTLGENEDLFSTRLVAKNINLIPFDKIDRPMRLLAKARYRQAPAYARVEQTDTDTLVVEFEDPQRAICQGQSLVLYDGDYLVGGGIIHS